jgi:hypothetical protein
MSEKSLEVNGGCQRLTRLAESTSVVVGIAVQVSVKQALYGGPDGVKAEDHREGQTDLSDREIMLIWQEYVGNGQA